MKIKINEYEIEIKAKHMYSDKACTDDVMSFLNTICMYAGESATWYDKIGMDALAKRARNFHNDIYDALDSKGYFKDCHID